MQLTIRGLPPEMEEAVRKVARDGDISLNKAVIRLLEKALSRSGSDEPGNLNHGLDRFSGVWTAEEAAELDEILGKPRTVDEELWR